ncbi:sigma-54 interaction domain-containing protein [Pseudalkalibacillus caeni]|uniref:PAS domain S-box protein n=1 Tax=Exobacillus caeni TaxID=2574798 RepID=A0A5R9FCS2_9BACL|nr:sigma 54-interacting transcriptional regulator [Pseudalkalibacillus caeni]TLS38354.1 PAS domain S-box protein [Pseudalkalibacillus caeni]
MFTSDKRIKTEILETVIDNAFQWFVVVDRNGIVTYMNKSYCKFLGYSNEQVIGKHVTDVIENTRMHIVARTGKEELADLQYIRGNYMIANRLPIVHEGKVIGAVGIVIFRDTEEWKKMNSHIKGLLSELEYYRNQMKDQSGAKYSLHDIVGESIQIKELKERVKQVAPGDISVLIRGESGTGKELFAHSIHQLSERNNKPFVKVNCGAIPDQLLESELFGYEEGAFTGAKKGGKIGKFKLADGGTIFLDEIGDMPLNMQVKLLRVLQEKEVEAIGSVKPEKIDVRVICATNRPLEKMVEENRFREDLFYRINVIQMVIPPLRERLADVKELARHFLIKNAARTGKRVTSFEEKVLDVLIQHNWPGNARELENVVEAAVHLSRGEQIMMDSLPDYLKESPSLAIGQKSLKEILEETERKAIEASLKRYENDKLKAAKALGIGKSSFYEKLKKYNMT